VARTPGVPEPPSEFTIPARPRLAAAPPTSSRPTWPLLVWPVWAWLCVFVAAPGAILAAIALAAPAEGIPPLALGWNTDSLATLVSDPYYRDAFMASFRVAAVSAAICLLAGYPMALAIARSPPSRRQLLLVLVILPFWTGFLLRIAAWIGLLRDDGWINAALQALGLTDAPIRLLHTDFAMIVGIVYAYLPFMVLPLEARLARADPALEQAAADLGASRLLVFVTVTLPLSLPGVLAGLILVFVPVAGEYVIPELLGGPGSRTMGRVIWDEFFASHDWPLAAALSLALLGVLLVPVIALRRGV
jgi:putrescine transport system permease protein